VILLAAAFRLPNLAARPMHADEAVHADKFGSLLEHGTYVYDRAEYHGPTLYYLTLPVAWLQGARRYVDVDEVTVRLVPALAGIALVALHLGARSLLGAGSALMAALLAAISPAMVFYSRYYIHETLLVFFTFGALVAAGSYLRRADLASALVVGACVGLMHATKETAPLALLSMLLALPLSAILAGSRAEALGSLRRVSPRHVLAGLVAAAAVSSLLFSSFLSNPRGVVDSFLAYQAYLARAGAASWHFHSWDYYLRLLVHFPSTGTPVWTEGLILVLAVVGFATGLGRTTAHGADPRVLRFLGVYTLLMLAFYSAIPYKTPWCLLGFLHGLILLAGVGAVFLVRVFRSFVAKALVCLLLIAGAAHLAWQAYAGSFPFASDPRNPYVYAHTGTDVFTIVRRLQDLARAHPDGLAMPIQVMSRTNLWPLPFYLRAFSNVAWWTGVSDSAPSAPVILVTPDMEPALVRKLYDLPPPGQRELYVGIFERAVELRPQVELRGFARNDLWEEFRRQEAAASSPNVAGAAR
jgi:uncharacterized protein (TIGR03663 family)